MLRLRELRKQRGYTIVKLSKDTGITRPNLSRYERGLGNPTVKTLQRLAAVLEVHISDLFPLPDPTRGVRDRTRAHDRGPKSRRPLWAQSRYGR
jgi:transcriptional regulator with XRE-family HTH domain